MMIELSHDEVKQAVAEWLQRHIGLDCEVTWWKGQLFSTAPNMSVRLSQSVQVGDKS